MALTRTQVDGLAAACLALGEEASDNQGFVSVRELLHRFDAELVMRPLLVEAMLCEAAEVAPLADRSSRWRLLVDDEKYEFTPTQVDEETSATPLPERFRNTIAHELTHSLAFRGKEFGVALMLPKRGQRESAADLVADIERRTEQLSPLLLMPDSVVDKWFPSALPHLSIEHLMSARKSMAVSRHLLVQRLNLLAEYGNPLFIERQCFQDVAVGLGTWTREGVALLSGWPLFSKFRNGEPPAFVPMLRKAKSMGASTIVAEQTFVLNGGASRSVVLEVPAVKPNRMSLLVELSVEPIRARAGATFLFLARRVLTFA
jgi:hypothetical protein